MPSSSPTRDESSRRGRLFVVALPIGNPDDITLRAIETLRTADLIAAEDTRNAARLLAAHSIRAPLISYHEHNESERTPQLIQKLRGGSSIALISDAGTPSVSDPGYRIVCEAVSAGIQVTPIPGVSAAMAALSVSGMPTDSFVFIGFPPRKKGPRARLLQDLAGEPRTLVFYESPRRIVSFLREARAAFGDRPAMLGREMTKTYEEYLRGPLSEITLKLSRRPSVKGETTLLVSGRQTPAESLSGESLRSEIRKRLETSDSRPSEISREIAEAYSLPRRKVYEETMRVKKALKK